MHRGFAFIRLKYPHEIRPMATIYLLFFRFGFFSWVVEHKRHSTFADNNRLLISAISEVTKKLKGIALSFVLNSFFYLLIIYLWAENLSSAVV